MERLTNKDWHNLCQGETCGKDNNCANYHRDGCRIDCNVPKLYAKLAEYEDAEEQGRLVRLKFAFGDEIYWNELSEGQWKTRTAKVRQFGGEDKSLWYICDVNKKSCVCLNAKMELYHTREKAEKALKEREKE